MAFENIAGQHGAVRILERALRRERLAHALIFSGPDGVGKKLCALALARELVCASRPGGMACGECRSCRLAGKAFHPDITVISPEGKAGEIKIESVRNLRKQLYLQPVEGGCRVFIIDEAEKLNEESSNALLKALEEPPRGSFMILLTSEPYYLSETIISRCQSVKFARLSPENVRKVLEKNINACKDEILLLSELSDGSPGRAFSLYHDGLGRRKDFFDWLFPEGGKGLDIENVLRTCEEKIGLNEKSPGIKRTNILGFFNVLSSWYRDVLTSAAGGADFINSDFSARIRQYARGVSVAGASRALGIILDAEQRIKLFANPRLVFEVAVLELSGIRGR